MTALIWDLDGTLLNSYKVILESVLATLREEGVEPDPAETYRKLIASSVKSFLSEVSPEPDRLWERYRQISTARDGEVTLMDGAAETLEALRQMGVPSFVYTHKGATAREVLSKLGVLRYFTDVLSAGAGLPRKPAPDGIDWLVKKFGLDKSQTFYVGDRPIDVECALRAGVKSVLFLPASSPAEPTGREDYIVSDLREIPGLLNKSDGRTGQV